MDNTDEEYCTPDVLELENKFHSADFSCCNCAQTDCFYWHIYNSEDVLI